MQPGLSARVGKGLRNPLVLSVHQCVQSRPAPSSDTGVIHRKTVKNVSYETFSFLWGGVCVVYILLPWKGHEQQPKYFAQISDSYLSKSFLIHVIHVPLFFLTFLRGLVVFPEPAFSAEVHISFSTLIFLSISTTASRQGQAAVRGGKFSKTLAKWWHKCHFTLTCLCSYLKLPWSPGCSGAICDML